MGEIARNYLTVPEDPSLDTVLGRMPGVCPELEGLSFTRGITFQGGKGQGLEGRPHFVFVHVAEDKIPFCQSILNNFGYLNPASNERKLDDGLSDTDIDDLIRLAAEETLQNFSSDAVDYIQ